MRVFKIVFFAVFLIFGIWEYREWSAKKFSLQNIQQEVPLVASENIDENLPSELLQMLDQPFIYLDQGHQSYVFQSQDQQYVLKFFKAKPGDSEWAKKKNIRNFIGFRLAYEKDRENCGLVYIHLRPTEGLIKRVILEGIDLDKVVFAVQRKGESTGAVLERLLNSGDVATVKKRLRDMFDMYLSTYQKGLYDRDHNLMDNTGFIGEKPVRLDVGKLRQDDRFKDLEFARKDLEKVFVKRVDKWLKVHFPKYLEEIHWDMQQKINEIFNMS